MRPEHVQLVKTGASTRRGSYQLRRIETTKHFQKTLYLLDQFRVNFQNPVSLAPNFFTHNDPILVRSLRDDPSMRSRDVPQFEYLWEDEQ